MKNYFILSFAILFTKIIYSQHTQLKWAKQFGGIAGSPYYQNNGTTVKTDATGNVYTIGEFRGTVDFDPGSSTYYLNCTNLNVDLYISKVDSNGNFIWAKSIKGQPPGCTIFSQSFVFTNDGGIVITGFFSGSADFDPGSGTHIVTNTNSSTEGFVFKLTSNGDFVWVKKINAPSLISLSAAFDIDVTKNGEIILTGIFFGLCDFDPRPQSFSVSTTGFESDIFLLKLDADGNFIWVKTFGGGDNDGAQTSSIDNAGNIYLSDILRVLQILIQEMAP